MTLGFFIGLKSRNEKKIPLELFLAIKRDTSVIVSHLISNKTNATWSMLAITIESTNSQKLLELP